MGGQPVLSGFNRLGQKKGLIVIGLEASEEPGCGEVAAWLKSFISEVPVEWIPAGEPFAARSWS